MKFTEASITDYPAIYKRYMKDFPKSERKPFSMIMANVYKKKISKVFVLKDNNKLCGYAVTIRRGKNKLILLDYLAVDPSMRSKGCGSRILEELSKEFMGTAGIFLEIETPGKGTSEPENEQRSRRQEFYERNGFEMQKLMLDLFGVDMRIMYLPIKKKFSDEEFYSAINDFYDKFFENKTLRSKIIIDKSF